MLTVVKVGGNIIDDEKKFSSFLEIFASIGGNKILVHGGGKIASNIGERLGIVPNYVDGRRITNAETLKLVTMVYAGLINKNIVATLQSKGCNAIGITGADANIIKAVKRLVKDVDYGYVGDITESGIAVANVSLLLNAGLVPVVAPLTHDGNGTMLNTNADTIAQELAKAMCKVMAVQLVYGFEKDGVLKDATDNNSVISEIMIADFDRLKNDGIINGGMLPKLQNACTAIQYGVSKVIIGNAMHLPELINGTAGTQII
ncbi:MAG TPA: acetylglutamate kinase [Flavipsychrobacter sp.]